MKETSYMIGKPEDRYEVTGFVYADFGIRKHDRPHGYRIDHLPTGFNVTQRRLLPTVKAAIEFIDKLYLLGPWASSDQAYYTPRHDNVKALWEKYATKRMDS